MFRSIAAVVVGFLLIGCLAFGTDMVLKSIRPEWFAENGAVSSTPVLLFMMVYVAIYAIAGCYLAGRIAPSNPMKHALILGVLGLLFNIMNTVTLWDTAPAWFHIASLALVMPYAWIGGRLAEKHRAAKPEAQSVVV